MKCENKSNYFSIILIILLFTTTTSVFAHCCPGPCCASKPVSFKKLMTKQKAMEEQIDKKSFWQTIKAHL